MKWIVCLITSQLQIINRDYVPFSLTYNTFPWKYKITVPYVNISGPGNVIGGADGGIVIGTDTDGRISEHGIGDSILSTTYSLDDLWGSAPFIDITAKIKLPTADNDKALGTGETDYSLQLDIANTYNKHTPFGTLGYKIVGDPGTINYDNRIYGTIGINYKLSDIYSTGLLFDYRQAIVDTVEDQKEGVAYLNWKPARHLSVMGYLVSGFSDGSPDSGLGFQFKYSR